MTLGGILAAVVGLCAALLILFLRVRERHTARPQEVMGGSTPDMPVPAAHSSVPLPAGPTIADDAARQTPSAPTGDEPAEKPPASAFKPYVPPRKP